MKKIFLLLILALAICGCNYKQEQMEELAGTPLYDTTNLVYGENVRELTGEWFNYEPSTDITIIMDETGELWCLRQSSIRYGDHVRLWIEDNGTPDNIEDDRVIEARIEAA